MRGQPPAARPGFPPPHPHGRRGGDGRDQLVEAGGAHGDEHGLHGRPRGASATGRRPPESAAEPAAALLKWPPV